MQPFFLPTVVLRHRKENLKKCSLRGLEGRFDFRFYSYPRDVLSGLEGYLLLDLAAPPLTIKDKGHGLFVLDATWRYAEVMYRQVVQSSAFIHRSLPPEWQTAYPRRQEDCPDPARGLASVEAIFIAYFILGRDTSGLLDGYHWAERFLALNRELLLE